MIEWNNSRIGHLRHSRLQREETEGPWEHWLESVKLGHVHHSGTHQSPVCQAPSLVHSLFDCSIAPVRINGLVLLMNAMAAEITKAWPIYNCHAARQA